LLKGPVSYKWITFPIILGLLKSKRQLKLCLGRHIPTNQVQLPTYSKHIKSLLRNHTWTNDGQGSTSFSQRSALASAMATDPTEARLGWGIEYYAFKNMDMRMAS